MIQNECKGSRILLVEDEESLAAGLKFNLEEEGYQVVWVEDGNRAIDCFRQANFDLIILDVMLPYLDGFEVAKRVRTQSPKMPILMLTARTGLKDRVQGLELGADDYMTKPFHLTELLARITGMLRRKMWYQDEAGIGQVYRFGRNEINFDNFECVNGNHRFQLTFHEAMVMKYLVENKGKVVARKELLENVWQIHSEIETRTVDNFIMRLRKYFEPDPAKPIYFKSIRSAGYLFTYE